LIAAMNASRITVSFNVIEPSTDSWLGADRTPHLKGSSYLRWVMVETAGDDAGLAYRVNFPNPDALLRLAGAVLVEAHDEWQTGDRRYLGETTMALLTPPPATGKEVAHPELIPA